jgi:DNA mismatch endonuclease (patch repair protein)
MVLKSFLIEKDIIQVPKFEESAGFYTTKTRSKIMSHIRAKNSKPELLLRRSLWAKHVRFRIHRKDLPGNPDMVIDKYRLVVFVDGDFWHGYQWDEKRHKNNQAFWIPKIKRNMQRDQFVNQSLTTMGYTVMRFWEHEVKQNLNACVNQVLLYIETAREMKVPLKE